MTDPVLDLSAVDSQRLLEGLGDAVVVADEENRVVYVNASAERLLRLPRDELVGRPLVTIVPERLRDAHLEGFARYLATREPHVIGRTPVAVPALRADGTEVAIELTLTAHALADGRHVFVGSLRDISDRVALEQERALSRYLLAMREVSRRLAAVEFGSVQEAGPVLLEAVGESLEWHVGGLWIVNGDQLNSVQAWAAPGFEAAAAAMVTDFRPLRRGEGLPGRVLADGEPAWVEDVRRDANFPRRPIAAGFGLRSCFAFPILIHGDVVAVVEFFSVTSRAAEPDLLPAMASAGSEIGRLIEREEARQQAAHSRAHLIGMAEALQASLLPPRPPVIPGVELAARYHAAAGEGQVGGDFFDVFALPDGAWAVVVGDVAGRGPRAAALTALARYTIRAAAVGSTRASDILRVLNDVVLRELEATDELGERFLTVAVLILEPSPDGVRVHHACGGHPPPLVLRDEGAVEESDCRGELVGVFEAFEAVDGELMLAPGDAIVLFTDGAIEGRGAHGPFGVERLRATLAKGHGLSAQELAASLERAVVDYIGGHGQDDLAIVVVRLPERSQGVHREAASDAVTPEPAIR